MAVGQLQARIAAERYLWRLLRVDHCGARSLICHPFAVYALSICACVSLHMQHSVCNDIYAFQNVCPVWHVVSLTFV